MAHGLVLCDLLCTRGRHLPSYFTTVLPRRSSFLLLETSKVPRSSSISLDIQGWSPPYDFFIPHSLFEIYSRSFVPSLGPDKLPLKPACVRGSWKVVLASVYQVRESLPSSLVPFSFLPHQDSDICVYLHM